MALIGGTFAYNILHHFWSTGETHYLDGSAYRDKSKLEVLLGEDVWQKIAGKVVIDFGCGVGAEVIEMAQHGARRVIGIDIRESLLAEARKAAGIAGVTDRCQFGTAPTERADVITAIDSFEHFDEPEEILSLMRDLIKEDGRALISFGPTWYHPLGGHIFSVFPWAHFVFSEQAFMRWFRDLTKDNHRTFRDVGLNRMTVSRFEKILRQSDWQVERFEAVPIRRLRRVFSPLTREFTTAIVRCELSPKPKSEGSRST
jgi:2-polyprenyl-3-methyl-5-hydroxy-6-metoxy-1,4-benzoquinol methylase